MSVLHARGLALACAALTGCAGVTATTPSLLPGDLHVGALDQRTHFELDQSSAPPPQSQPADAPVDTPSKQRRRKVLYVLGLGAIGVGAAGTLAFGIGGRIVQAQVKNGFDDGSLTRDRADTLTTTGDVMNGLMIGSTVLGLAGVILAATTYGIDHARCGDLPPRRKHCPRDEAPADAEPQ
ncbi:MAG: hypothetical protein KDK70_18280 [Myxococcales bacterium]|nr:hypothetical protein [Myxococcales bacterium]